MSVYASSGTDEPAVRHAGASVAPYASQRSGLLGAVGADDGQGFGFDARGAKTFDGGELVQPAGFVIAMENHEAAFVGGVFGAVVAQVDVFGIHAQRFAARVIVKKTGC
mgnify:CR=1 FL=1